MEQGPYWGSTNSRCCHSKFCYNGNQVLGFVHPWYKLFNEIVYVADVALLGEDILSKTGM
jgi:hypothetical protein